MYKILIAAITFFSFSAYSKEDVLSKKEIVFTETTEAGYQVKLIFADEVSTKSVQAKLCSETESKLVLAKLWMKMEGGHEHGSTPTEIEALENQCSEISKINFVMAGKWQIHVKFEDEDKAVFNFNVKKSQ